jgi:hypothetical protein
VRDSPAGTLITPSVKTVLVVHPLAGSQETELVNDREGRSVCRRNGEDEVTNVALFGHVHQHSRRLCGVATPPIRHDDRVAELDRIGRVHGVAPRRTVVAGVPDHLPAEDDRMHTPGQEPRVLMHLPNTHRKESSGRSVDSGTIRRSQVECFVRTLVVKCGSARLNADAQAPRSPCR